MKLKAIFVLILILGLVGVILFSSAAYTVDETEQAVITQFGRPVGAPVLDPGLHFKTPFIQDVHRFEKRIMEWDSENNEVPTKDKKFIQVDCTARWRIVDPLEYFKKVQTEAKAQSRLDDIVEGAIHEVIPSLELIESVRTSNRPFLAVDAAFKTEYDSEEYTITTGRHKIGEMIRDICTPKVEPFGIELVDVRLRRINYVKQVRDDIYHRMISERNRIAEYYRSEGLGKQLEIEGKREKELKTIESKAYRDAEEIKGKADAEAASIYALAYGEDPEFYAFLTTLEAYETTITQGVDLILTTDSDFFRYLKSMDSPGKGP